MQRYDHLKFFKMWGIPHIGRLSSPLQTAASWLKKSSWGQ